MPRAPAVGLEVTMRTTLQSSSARIARVTLGLGIIAAGLVAMAGPASGIYVIAGAPPLLIVGSLFAVGLAIHTQPKAAMILTLVLPLVAGPYAAFLYAARGFGAAGGLALAALGAAVMAAAVVNPLLRVQGHKEAHA
jgi:hypothetical protein